MSMDIVSRLRCVLKGDKTAQAGADEIERLRAELTRVTAQRDAILMQARIWSGEAKAQKSTVDAVGEILGGVPDWGPIAQGVEQLRAELAASREREARMQWQPIETAPRDGTMVLLAGGLAAPSDWRIKVGYWASEDGAWYIFGGSWRPTRWMPLDGLYAALAEGAKG